MRFSADTGEREDTVFLRRGVKASAITSFGVSAREMGSVQMLVLADADDTTRDVDPVWILELVVEARDRPGIGVECVTGSEEKMSLTAMILRGGRTGR